MGVESQNLLYTLSELGMIERNQHEVKTVYVLESVHDYFRPDMSDLKCLQDYCKPDKMWMDSTENKVYLEYDS